MQNNVGQNDACFSHDFALHDFASILVSATLA
jgi:hypothetical protein